MTASFSTASCIVHNNPHIFIIVRNHHLQPSWIPHGETYINIILDFPLSEKPKSKHHEVRVHHLISMISRFPRDDTMNWAINLDERNLVSVNRPIFLSSTSITWSEGATYISTIWFLSTWRFIQYCTITILHIRRRVEDSSQPERRVNGTPKGVT